jgi:hypothetical protein
MNIKAVWLGWCQSTPSRWLRGAPLASSTTQAQGWCAASGRHDLGARILAVHAQRHWQGPGQRVEAALAALGQQFQQLYQLLPPGLRLPEHGEGFAQGPPARAGAKQLGAEHPPLAPIPLVEPLGIGSEGAARAEAVARSRSGSSRCSSPAPLARVCGLVVSLICWSGAKPSA